MIIDNEKQREILLELLNKSNFNGEVVDDIYHCKQALLTAKLYTIPSENKNENT